MINGFKISISGENSYLTIKSNSYYITLFYMNKINNKESVYEYYIYLAECNDKNYELYNSLNENKPDGQEEKLSNLFTVKTNKYYFEIKNNPDEFGYFTLNNNKITERALIDNNNDYILDFIVTKNDILGDTTITVNYIVSVEDEKAYSKDCQITLTFLGSIIDVHSGGGNNEDINNDNPIKIPEIFGPDTGLEQFKEVISNDISLYINSSKVINGSDFLAMVLSSDNINPEEQLKNGISAIDLGNCINIIKAQNHIDKDKNLIILNIQSKNNYENQNEDDSLIIGKSTYIEIYNNSGTKLDLSVCKEEIKIMKYIGDIEKLDLETAHIFSNNGIDVFNAADDFFNDICHPFDNPFNKDITINDRRNDIYQNVTFCQNGCKYNGVNYSLSYVNCLCNSSFFQDEKNNDINTINTTQEFINFKVLSKVFIENLLNFNFRIIKCYNLVLNIKILIPNIGFYCMSSMLVIQIILFFIYLIKKLNPLKKFILIFKINQDKNNYLNNNKKFIKNEENSKKYCKNKNRDYDLLNINTNSKKDIINNNKDKICKKINLKKQKSSFKKWKNVRDTQKMETLKKVNTKNNIKFKNNEINKIEFSNSNIQEFDFEQAIIYDKRNYLKMYWGFLLDSQIIFSSLCTDNNFDLFVIKLSFLVFNFQLSLFLNAFFYTDEYISNAYYNNGVLDFFSGLPKSIYSFIATLLITNLLKNLSSSKNELIKVISKKRKSNNYINIINIKLAKLRKKLIIYFILVFFLSLFFIYYITIFCAVYKYSQKYWFLGCLESFGIDFLVSLIINIFLALFRYISIKKNIKCLFVFANIINAFI